MTAMPSQDSPQSENWLRTIMIERGYHLEGPRAGGLARLAADSGLSAATVSRLAGFIGEKYTIPNLDTLRALSPVLGMSLWELMIRSGIVIEEELPPTTAAVTAIPDRVLHAISHSRLTRDQKQSLTDWYQSDIEQLRNRAITLVKLLEATL